MANDYAKELAEFLNENAEENPSQILMKSLSLCLSRWSELCANLTDPSLLLMLVY